MKAIYFYDTPLGRIGLIEQDETLIRLLLPGEKYPEQIPQIETTFLKQVNKELEEYFDQTRLYFTVPCKPLGTEFQMNVWNSLLKIPYGKVVSYQEVASDIGNKKASRAIGRANHHNPIPIIIPCHRVVGKNLSLVGYGGGLPLKIKLLELEGIKIEDNRISCIDK